jgi:hypothetical protein
VLIAGVGGAAVVVFIRMRRNQPWS